MEKDSTSLCLRWLTEKCHIFFRVSVFSFFDEKVGKEELEAWLGTWSCHWATPGKMVAIAHWQCPKHLDYGLRSIYYVRVSLGVAIQNGDTMKSVSNTTRPSLIFWAQEDCSDLKNQHWSGKSGHAAKGLGLTPFLRNLSCHSGKLRQKPWPMKQRKRKRQGFGGLRVPQSSPGNERWKGPWAFGEQWRTYDVGKWQAQEREVS